MLCAGTDTNVSVGMHCQAANLKMQQPNCVKYKLTDGIWCYLKHSVLRLTFPILCITVGFINCKPKKKKIISVNECFKNYYRFVYKLL